MSKKPINLEIDYKKRYERLVFLALSELNEKPELIESKVYQELTKEVNQLIE